MSAYAFNRSINLSLIIKFFSTLSLCLYVLEKNCCLYCGNSKSNLLFLWTNSKIVNLLVKNFVTFFTSSSLSLLTKNLDFRDKNIFGFEIFLKNIPEPNKKLRQTKKSFQASDYQKSERDFAFVIDKIFKIGALEKIIKEVDDNLIQNVTTFDIYEGENIPKDKKSVAINVTLQAIDKTLSENDLDKISKKIIDTVKNKTGAIIRS